MYTLPNSYVTTYAICATYASNGTPLTTVFYRNKTMSSFEILYRNYGNESAKTEQSYVCIGY